MVRRKESDIVLSALRIIDPQLGRVEVIPGVEGPTIWVDIGLTKLVPISVNGDGMVRIAKIMLAMGSARGGLVLIDEIENGFHHSIMGRVWEAINAAARQLDLQVLATTHSRECIVAAYDACDSGDLRIHRLERVRDAIRCVTYSSEAIEGAVVHDFEVR